MKRARAVLDTNVIVSGLLFPGSVPSRALLKAQEGAVLMSEAMQLELLEVFSRPRFDRYASRAERLQLASAVVFASEQVWIAMPIRICRDARDDKFLEAAVYGDAQAIVTGDNDLLALDPFRDIRIFSPADFLAW